jgi:hypothetical protein
MRLFLIERAISMKMDCFLETPQNVIFDISFVKFDVTDVKNDPIDVKNDGVKRQK